MKLLKKITVTSLLFTLLASSIDFNPLKIFAGNKGNKENNIKIESILENNKPVSINKVILDSSSNPKSTESVNLNSRRLKFSDGYYTLDYGDGWVLGKDKGVIGTMIVPSGVEAVFQKRGNQSFINTIIAGASATFTKDFVSATIKAQYGHSWISGYPYEIYKTVMAPKDKNLFVKVERVFRKVDVIRVKNGEVVDIAETYKYSTCRFKKLEYSPLEKVDQCELYQKTTECILGEPDLDLNNIIDSSGYYEGYANIKNKEDYWSTKYYNANDTVGIYFTIPRSGKYELKEILYPKTVGVLENYIFAGAQKSLYEVDEYNNAKISPIRSIPANIRTYNKNQNNYPGDSSLTADLKQGKKYLIVFNAGKNDTDALKMYGKYSYRMRFKLIN